MTCDAGDKTVYFGDFTVAGEGAAAPPPAAGLSAIRQWYVACNSEAAVFFGDFVLERGQ